MVSYSCIIIRNSAVAPAPVPAAATAAAAANKLFLLDRQKKGKLLLFFFFDFSASNSIAEQMTINPLLTMLNDSYGKKKRESANVSTTDGRETLMVT